MMENIKSIIQDKKTKREISTEVSLEDKIWFCAFYEGEGSVSNDKSNNNRLRLSISQNDRTPLEIGQSIWGGNIRERVKQSKNKTCYGNDWVLNHNASLKFLDDIKPYMKIPVKQNQIKVVMDNFEKGWHGQYKCNFCDNIYSNASGRRRHELKMHINKNQKHTCDVCNKTYDSKDSLTRHLKQHKNELTTNG